MQKSSITCETAMRQAGMTIGQYLSQARDEIDKRFGKGFSESNPDLLGRCVVAQSIDFETTAICTAIWEIAEALDGIKENTEKLAED